MMWKKAASLGIAGFAAGLLIGAGFILFTGLSEGLAPALPHILVSGLYGAAAMGSNVFYEIESWSIARATAVHFLLVMSLYCLAALSMGWFTAEDPVFWMVIAVMAAGYILIWLFQYLCYRREIRRMNEDLKKIQSGQDGPGQENK